MSKKEMTPTIRVEWSLAAWTAEQPQGGPAFLAVRLTDSIVDGTWQFVWARQEVPQGEGETPEMFYAWVTPGGRPVSPTVVRAIEAATRGHQTIQAILATLR